MVRVESDSEESRRAVDRKMEWRELQRKRRPAAEGGQRRLSREMEFEGKQKD